MNSLCLTANSRVVAGVEERAAFSASTRSEMFLQSGGMNDQFQSLLALAQTVRAWRERTSARTSRISGRSSGLMVAVVHCVIF